MMRNMVALSWICAAAFAAPDATPTIDQSLSMKSASDAQISPDGRYVAYVVQQANWDENEFTQQIWAASIVTGERFQLTSGKKSSSGPQWSPDSRRLAFASDRDGKRQIYLIAPTGGEAVQLTTEENGVDAMAWSPDGSSIAFTSTGPESKKQKERKEKFGDFEVVGGDYTMTHLWLVQVPAEVPSDRKQLPRPVALTKGDQFNVTSFSWSPDGKRIALSAARDPDLGSRDTEQLYVLDLADQHLKKVTEAGSPNARPKWSPDGKQIAFVTSAGSPFYYYTNTRIAMVPAEGGSPAVLTTNFDENPILLDWGPDGIFFAALQTSNAHVFRIDPATRQIKRISGPEQFHLANASFTRDRHTLAGIGAAPNGFAEF
jgi:Tol biopolymer transport system component